MRVPSELLRETAIIEDFGGSGSRGPVYAEPRSVKISFQPTSRMVTDVNGIVVPVSVLAIIRPEKGPVRPESKLTARGDLYRVVQCYPQPDERRPSHYELALSSLAARATYGASGSGS